FKENLFSIGLGDMGTGTGVVGQAGAGMGSAGPGNGTGQAVATISSPAFEVVGNKDQGLVIRIREGFRPNDVLEYFIRQNIDIRSFNELLPSLNDIFIRLVEGTPLARQFQPVTA
ncbi:MAG TPA: DUF4162 domain-containing protein, partial [Puia sp.]|nr:DUF4162 domain-containing protein [Puia sp.]